MVKPDIHSDQIPTQNPTRNVGGGKPGLSKDYILQNENQAKKKSIPHKLKGETFKQPCIS